MATRRTSIPQTQKPMLELTMSRDDAKARLQDRIEKGRELKQCRVDTREMFESLENEYRKWNAFNTELLKRVFTTVELADEYGFFGASIVSMREPSLEEKIVDIYKRINEKLHRLESIIERLELIPLGASAQSNANIQQQSFTQPQVKKVFIVHGRDETAKANLEIFLHELEFEPVVLHRQADEGMTIIEKFEKHSDVGYAFILLTPDEVAYLVSEEPKPDEERQKEFRSRPNVIFEFGYFVGKLGRSRVCCLYTGNVSLPSDVSGMIYKRYNTNIEEVGYSIIKDLKASGYSIS